MESSNGRFESQGNAIRQTGTFHFVHPLLLYSLYIDQTFLLLLFRHFYLDALLVV